VAEVWNERNLRLEQCLRLCEEALVEIDRSQKANPAFAKFHAFSVASGRFETLRVEAAAARKLQNFEKAQAVLDQMKHWLDENQGDYPRPNYLYLSESALLSEARGHKLDALAYYRILFSRFPPNSQDETHVLALWKEMGGTDEGFKLWSSLEQRKKPAVANQPSAWTDMNKQLTALNASDNNGKTWTISDLKGKTTLINVWATWCGPCRAELPDLQRLFEQVTDRKDIQVVSISVDGNPGIIGPFLKEGHYTFPVILAQGSFVDELASQSGIPRTWIVDANGTVRLERLGYDPADWPREMLQKMTTLK